MASFFQQIISLADEPVARGNAAADNTEDVSALPRDILAARVESLQHALSERTTAFNDLHREALQLRNDYDAFRARAETIQHQIMQERDADRRIVEQLRASKVGDDSNEVFVQSMNETVSKYKEQLRAAQDDAQRAVKRFKELEDTMRQQTEAHSRDQELLQSKFDQLRRRMQHQQDQRVGETGSRDDAVAQRLREAEARLRVYEAQNADAGPEKPSEDAPPALMAKLAAMATSHESELQGVRDAHTRALQAAEWAQLDTEKQLADAKTQLDAARLQVKTLSATHEQQLEAAEAARRQHQQRIDTLSQALEEARGRHEAAATQAAQDTEVLRRQIEELQAAATQHASRATEGDDKAQREIARVEVQRAQLEMQIAQLVQRLQEADVRRRAVEDALHDARQDIRARDDAIDLVRNEADRHAMRATEFEGQVLVLQRTLSLREEEVLHRERALQPLRTQLDELRARCDKVNTQLQQTTAQLQDAREEADHSRVELERLRAAAAAIPLVVPSTVGEASFNADASVARSSGSASEWQQRFEQEQQVAIEAVRAREEQSARARVLEGRLEEAQRMLQAERLHSQQLRSDATRGTGGTAVQIAPAPAATATSVLQAAGPGKVVQQMRQLVPHSIRSAQWTPRRLLAVLAAVVFMLFAMVNGSVAADTRAVSELQDLTLLKEKYVQCMTSALACQEKLNMQSVKT